jgi:uncharacterized protein (DUF362 family)/Pyruvate/2-oxoacid:ferredoxin oxidoreductase delta subunit
MRACLAPLGGMGAFVKPGQRVLLKPNLLAGMAPERAVTTHPTVVAAAIFLVREAGGVPSVGDSPGVGDLAGVAKPTGIQNVLDETHTPLADFGRTTVFDSERNVIGKRMQLARALAEADVVITLPKLKTHVQMTFTGAIKNQFGLIPGVAKGKFHLRLQEIDHLAELIVDINLLARPALAIMDAIEAMEGDGPNGGDARHVGLMLAGSDLTAVDATACRIVGIDALRVPTTAAAVRRGCGVAAEDRIEICGPALDEVRIPDFKPVAHLKDALNILPLPGGVIRRVRAQWAARPRIERAVCIQCYACRNGCPVVPPAIDPDRAAGAEVDDRSCIRCYCCHEFCPVKAVSLHEPWLERRLKLTRVLNWMSVHLRRLLSPLI